MSVFNITGKRESFAFSAENPTGSRNGGSKGKPCEKLHASVRVNCGDVLTLVDTDGPGMITHMWFGACLPHGAIIRMYWDFSEEPSVEVPASAFFGYPYDENKYDTNGNPVIINSSKIFLSPGRSYNSYWEMPFKKHCKITLEWRAPNPWSIYYMITGWRGEIPEDAGYFHAVYRQEHPVSKGVPYVVIDGMEGPGCFAGMFFAIGLNGNNECFCEGEVKMYIDGDTFPTINYTGTEDYFAGSYGFGIDTDLMRYDPLSGLYAGMYAVLGNTSERYNNQQRLLMYRWHEKDPIYFSKSFRMTMDNGTSTAGGNQPRYDDYTSVAFLYLKTPTRIPCALPPHAEMKMK